MTFKLPGARPSLTLLLALAALSACGDGSSSEPKDDMGYVTLDGGGTLNRDGISPPPPGDGGATPKQGQQGKFCNGVFINGKKISLAISVGSVTLAAASGACSKCLQLSAGKHPMSIYSGGSKVGAGTVSIAAGKEYVFWMSYDPATQKAKIEGKVLSPTQGEGCETFTPKL